MFFSENVSDRLSVNFVVKVVYSFGSSPGQQFYSSSRPASVHQPRWIISFSLISSVNSPSSHRSKRRLKQVMWSLTLNLMLGFCKRSEGMHMAALIEIDSSAGC